MKKEKASTRQHHQARLWRKLPAAGLPRTEDEKGKETMTTCAEKHHGNHRHAHGPDCEHTAIRHDDHVDYLHDGHLHHPHGDHVDEHAIAVNAINPVHCTPQTVCSHQHGRPAGTKPCLMATTSITSWMDGCTIPMVLIATTMGRYSWPDRCRGLRSGLGSCTPMGRFGSVERGGGRWQCSRLALAWCSCPPQRRAFSKRVEVRGLNKRAVIKLATERKRLTDIVKTVADQVKSDVLALLRPHYPLPIKRADSCCTICLPPPAPLSEGELHITLAALSLAYRTRAAQVL